jgi:hypothetical protein
LDQVPAHLLTRENLVIRNYDGLSVGRIAVKRGFVHQLPEPVRPKPRGLVSRFLESIGAKRPPF